MRNFVIAAVAILAFAGFITSAQARSKATNPEHFAQELKSGNQFEIESANLALKKSNTEPVKNFANRLIGDHTAAADKLKNTLKQAGLPEPAMSVNHEQQAMLSKLENLNGAAFNRRFVKDQIQAHKKAISLLQSYSNRGTNSELKQLALSLLPTLKEHLQIAERLQPEVTARR